MIPQLFQRNRQEKDHISAERNTIEETAIELQTTIIPEETNLTAMEAAMKKAMEAHSKADRLIDEHRNALGTEFAQNLSALENSFMKHHSNYLNTCRHKYSAEVRAKEIISAADRSRIKSLKNAVNELEQLKHELKGLKAKADYQSRNYRIIYFAERTKKHAELILPFTRLAEAAKQEHHDITELQEDLKRQMLTTRMRKTEGKAMKSRKPGARHNKS